MKYKIGDRVRIVRNREGQEYWNSLGGMDKYLGTTMTIIDYYNGCDSYPIYRMKEDNCMWCWYEYMIECKEENKMFCKSDLANGDLLVMRNGERYVVMQEYATNKSDTWVGVNTSGWCDPGSFEENLIHNGWSNDYDVVKVMRPAFRYANPYHYDEKDYDVVFDRNEERKKMTVEDIERELGYKIAVVDKEGN